MDIAISNVNRIFKTYQGQARIAELNSKNPVKRAQGQRDLVSISGEARAALTKHAMKHLLAELRSSHEMEVEGIPSENLEAPKIQTDKVDMEEDEVTSSTSIAE